MADEECPINDTTATTTIDIGTGVPAESATESDNHKGSDIESATQSDNHNVPETEHIVDTNNEHETERETKDHILQQEPLIHSNNIHIDSSPEVELGPNVQKVIFEGRILIFKNVTILTLVNLDSLFFGSRIPIMMK